MINLLKSHLASELENVLKKPAELIAGMLEAPKQAGHGHLALPIFAWAKEFKKAPPALALELQAQLQQCLPKNVKQVHAVSGFLNFEFDGKFIQDQLMTEIQRPMAEIGNSKVGLGKTLVIDYASPNVAKPMHIGHLRAAVIGQALVNLAKTQGYTVVGLNHLGDWGVQFGKLAWAFLKWGKEYPFEEKPFESLFAIYVRFHEEAAKDPAIEDEGSRMFKRLEDGDNEIKKIWQKFVDISLKDYNRVWSMLGVRHDKVIGESFYNDLMKPVEKELEEKKLLEESDGAMVVRLDSADMPPCLIRKSDGASLYATRDLASAIYRKENLKADLNLYVVGMDQTLHFRQVFKVLELMGRSWHKDCHHIGFGMYRFKDGKLSTRSGNVIFLEDVLKQAIDRVRDFMVDRGTDVPDLEKVARQVGVGAVVFNDLFSDRVKNVEFDWDRVLDFEGDSGPYVQYCGVRCASLIRKYGKKIHDEMKEELTSPEEVELIRTLIGFDAVLKNSFSNFKPHILAGYLIDVCHKFGQFYNKQRILGEAPDLEAARMSLVMATLKILEKGLGLLSIELPDAM